MNDLHTHEQYVREHLDDRTAARALVDHIEEACNLPHRVALRAVAAIRKTARDAGEMAEAAAILADKDGIGQGVECIIRSAGSEPWRLLSTILIVPGDRFPDPGQDHLKAFHGGYLGMVLRIGARRVLKIAAAVRDDPHAAELREDLADLFAELP